MLKIAVCDDDRDTVARYVDLISQYAKKHDIDIELSRFYSGESLLFQYEDISDEIDILYLDIIMDKTDGMETARRLRDAGCLAQIVFLTTSESHVYAGYEVKAIRYLLKDKMTADEFEKVFLQAAESASKKEEILFFFDFNGVTEAVPISQITHFEIWGKVTTVFLSNHHTGKFYSQMKDLEEQLVGKDFVRIHRSYMVHLPYIEKFDTQNVFLRNGMRLPVGKTYMQSLQKVFADYISRSHIYRPSSNCSKDREEDQ